MGFLKKEITPRASARVLTSSVGCPVIRMAEASGLLRLTSSSNSRPEMPGRRRSVTTRETPPSFSNCNASSPDVASTTSYLRPESSRLNRSIRRTWRWSSTMRMRGEVIGSTRLRLAGLPFRPGCACPYPMSQSIQAPAGHLVARGDLQQTGLLHRAEIHRHWAPGVKATTPGRVHRAGHISLENDALAAHMRIGHRYCRHQGLRVGVQRPVEELAAGR